MTMTIETDRAERPVLPFSGRRRFVRVDVWCTLVAIGFVAVTALDGSLALCVVRLLVVVGACTVLARLHRSSCARATLVGAVAVGAIAAVVGATVGYSYITTTGASVKGAGGVLALAGGLGLIEHGAAGLLHPIRGWRRLLAIPIGLVAGYAVLMPIAIATYATNVPRPVLTQVTPDERGLAYVAATFETSDGITLSGWYIPSRIGAAVVLLHGASSTRTNVLDRAAVLARHGYGVLLFDARGHGDSGGRAMEFGWYGDRDVAAAIDYLETRSDVDPGRIGAVGMSMGGEQVIGAMAGDARIAATVAEGATNRVFDDKAWIVDEFGLRGRLQRGVDWFTYRLTDLLTEASPPISLREAVARAAPRRVLLIVAGRVPDEQRAAEFVRSAAPVSVDVWVVPGSDHTGGLRTDAAEWEQRVTDFLDASLP